MNAKIGYEAQHYEIYLYGKDLADEEYDITSDVPLLIGLMQQTVLTGNSSFPGCSGKDWRAAF